jgi:hypothetical protein
LPQLQKGTSEDSPKSVSVSVSTGLSSASITPGSLGLGSA